MCESVPPDGGARLVTWRAGSARPAHQEYDLWVPPQHRMEGQIGVWSLWPLLVLGPPGSCPAHGHRGTRLEGQQPLHTQRSTGPLTSRTFLCQPSGLGMSAGRVATRPWASKTQCLPHRQKASSARHYPCQDTGSANLQRPFTISGSLVLSSPSPGCLEPGLKPVCGFPCRKPASWGLDIRPAAGSLLCLP